MTDHLEAVADAPRPDTQIDRFFELLDLLRDSEDEPCFVCGHTFADHNDPDGEGGADLKCDIAGCDDTHVFASFPKNWGLETDDARFERQIADGPNEYLIAIDKTVYESYWVRAHSPLQAEERLRAILSAESVTYDDADAPGCMYEPDPQSAGADAAAEYLLDSVRVIRKGDEPDSAINMRDILCPHGTPLRNDCTWCPILQMIGAVYLTNKRGFGGDVAFLRPLPPNGPTQGLWVVLHNYTDRDLGPFADYWPFSWAGIEAPPWWSPETPHAIAVGKDGPRFAYTPGGATDAAKRSFDDAVRAGLAAADGRQVHAVQLDFEQRSWFERPAFTEFGTVIKSGD